MSDYIQKTIEELGELVHSIEFKYSADTGISRRTASGAILIPEENMNPKPFWVVTITTRSKKYPQCISRYYKSLQCDDLITAFDDVVQKAKLGYEEEE